MKRTPLFEKSNELGAKVVEFGGFEMPIQYKTTLSEEHIRVREFAGLFDVSHMGNILIEGPDSEKFVNYLITNDVTPVEVGNIVYTFMCNEKGGTVDDFMVYRLGEESYEFVVNAANTDKDMEWITDKQDGFDVTVTDRTADIGIVALQGPEAQAILQKITDTDLTEIAQFQLDDHVEIAGVKTLTSRTGYTGEDGFEIYCDADDTPKIWDAILDVEHKGEKAWPVGLGCRDTLRFEAALPLYGNELSEDKPVVYLGMNFAVKLGKDDFIGKDALVKAKENPEEKFVGLELIGRGVPRQGYDLVDEDENKIGEITTGYIPPTVEKPIANAYIKPEFAEMGNEITVMLRKRPVKAKVISKRYLAK